MSDTVTFRDAWSGVADCRNCTLRESVLFAGLTEPDFEKIHKPINQLALKPGDTLYRSGENGTQLFTIRKGLLKLVHFLPDGSQRIVRLMRQSDIVGLEATLNQPYEHHAIAMHPTEICCLPTNLVLTMTQENQRVHQELLNRWQRALSDADAWITELSTGNARQRVARLLLRLALDCENNECLLFNREDMGAMLAITTETASRIIAEFKRQGLISEIKVNRFRLDQDALREIADG